jgi:hypothetical protein
VIVINAILIIVVFGVAIFFAIPIAFLRVIWFISGEFERHAKDWLDASIVEMKALADKKRAK